ncbi:MAG: MFS transporter [Acidobacteria bacterium]|nr:MFS transporter [Acidobacteriota bacterium]
MSGIPVSRYRWFILAVFVLSTTISYLDRQILAALAPTIQSEFSLNDAQYGLLLTAFSIPYALMAPFAGLWIDRIGLNRAIAIAVAVWSCAGIATGLTSGLASLIVCRALLGVAEAAGIPAVGKAIVIYTKAGERAVGHAMNQAAVTVGWMFAPLLATGLALPGTWRTRFIITGTLGLLWVPLWLFTGRNAPDVPRSLAAAPFRDRRLWIFAGANCLNGIPYSIWSNWTTKYLVTVFGLSTAAANTFAWIPPVFAMLGGFVCGWASMRLVRRGVAPPLARYRVCAVAALVALAGLALPLAPSPLWAAAGISLSMGAIAGLSVNLYALPLDTFDAARAAFAISILVASYGGVQAVISGPIGWVRDHYGYLPITLLAAVMPLLSAALLRLGSAGLPSDIRSTQVESPAGGRRHFLWRLLGKGPEIAVVTFRTGPEDLCRRMVEEVRALVPEHKHFVATEENWPQIRREIAPYRIGLVPVMLGTTHKQLRRAAYRLAPHKILAYNSRLERHHLRPGLPSLLFARGVPLDRIYLRPRWWPFPRRDRSVVPEGHIAIEGRRCDSARRRVAVLSPYLPYPLSHGGAVRIYHLLREIAREFDVELFAFREGDPHPALGDLPEFCARIVLVEKPRYREPRWSTLLPPEVHEYRSPAMRRALAEEKRAFGYEALQVEYTQLAEYPGDILVEHDVTFDLFRQIARRARTLASALNARRWHRFETAAVRRFPRVVVMSPKDAEMLGAGTVLENGVDLDRFRPEPETPGQRLLFIGSFRHFPNIAAYRYFAERVWPLLRDKFPEMTVTVVCGPDWLTYWRAFTDSPEPAPDARIRLHGFVADVRPLYVEANLVLVPTTVSAGTNVKVLEAMAMRRAVVSTPSGCAGLGLLHGHSVWEADTPEAFAAGIATLIADPERREQIAEAALLHARRNFDWRAIGEKQREILRGAIH